MQASPKVKDKKAEKWAEKLAPALWDGEVIWALISASRMKPQSEGTAITNARVVGFKTWESDEKRVVLSVSGDDIRGVDFRTKAGSTSMWVQGAFEETNFGSLDKSEVDFAQYYVQHLQQVGTATEVKDGLVAREQQVAAQAAVESEQREAERRADHARRGARHQVPVFGTPMNDKAWDAIHSHSGNEELPWFVINGGPAGVLATFEDRLLISKSGFMAGAFGGGRVTTFPYRDITNIEYNSGMMNGVLEVLTPSYQGTANHDYWRSSNKGRNKAHDDPWTLSNCLPLPKAVYKTAQPKLNELQRKIINSKQATVVVHHSPVEQAAPTGGLAEEIRKLANLHAQGLIDAEEFKAAKQAAIAKFA
ncbi:MAG: hypothetical protein DI630_09340 [Gordonia sp. (in: high G+C Gram-positive bacteria)]|nr:MAG: hypothetical protein DI630_09340 [Gordonia sp. (in: high G+C Gram-positive bacteria)]